MKKPKLKPCPWCGSEPKWGEGDRGGWSVYCLSDACAVRPGTAYHEYLDDAVTDWNARHGESQ